MYIILVSNGLSEFRDSKLCNLLGQTTPAPFYMGKSNSGSKYNGGSSILSAKIYVRKTTAERLIKRFNEATNKNSYSSPFNWISNKHLSCRELTRSEWDQISDHKLESEKTRHSRMVNKIEENRRKFK